MILKEGKGAEQVISSVVNQIKEQSEPIESNSLKLQQLKGGAPVTLTIGQKRKGSQNLVKSETVAKIRKTLKLSGRDTKKLCKIFREDDLKVEHKTKEFLAQVDNLLLSQYEVKKMEMEVKTKIEVVKMVRGRGGKLCRRKIKKTVMRKVNKDVVLVKDVKSFCEEIANMRGICPTNTVVRVCQDGGGGSFKSVVSVLDRSVNHSYEAAGEKLSGVNRLLPLALCKGIPETHHNLRLIMGHLKLERVPHVKLVMDLCLLNAVLGISSHGGKYSCAFCDGPSTLQSGNLRTFRDLRLNYEAYQAAGANPSQMKKFANVIQPCLISAPEKEKVISVVMLPQLHLMMGVVNHLVNHAVKFDQNIIKVLKQHNIFQHGYNGGGLDGNNSAEFLRKIELFYDDILPVLQPVLDVLLLFRDIVNGCFSWNLSEDFRERISNFTTSYENLINYSNVVLQQPLTVTWKIHCITAHLSYTLEEHGRGMADILEQVGESAHHSMKAELQRHKRSEENPSHGKMLLKAVSKYGSWNVFNMSGYKKSGQI